MLSQCSLCKISIKEAGKLEKIGESYKDLLCELGLIKPGRWNYRKLRFCKECKEKLRRMKVEKDFKEKDKVGKNVYDRKDQV